MNDGIAFIAKLQQAQQEARADWIDLQIPKLRLLITNLMEQSHELALLEQRAPIILESHEPPAGKRIRGK